MMSADRELLTIESAVSATRDLGCPKSSHYACPALLVMRSRRAAGVDDAWPAPGSAGKRLDEGVASDQVVCGVMMATPVVKYYKLTRPFLRPSEYVLGEKSLISSPAAGAETRHRSTLRCRRAHLLGPGPRRRGKRSWLSRATTPSKPPKIIGLNRAPDYLDCLASQLALGVPDSVARSLRVVRPNRLVNGARGN